MLHTYLAMPVTKHLLGLTLGVFSVTSLVVVPSGSRNRPTTSGSVSEAHVSHLSTRLASDSEPTKRDAATQARAGELYGNVPLSFEANLGQTDSQVRFLTRGSGYSLFLAPTEAVLAISKPSAKSPTVLRMTVVGGNPAPQVAGEHELPGRSHYFVGNKPEKWQTNIPHYAKVKYRDVYPQIDLVYYGKQRQLEYDFVVAPGADPNRIRLAFAGAQTVHIDDTGDVVLRTTDGEIRQHKPVIYQEVGGVRQDIAGTYVLTGENEVGFQIGTYDATQPLVIDPVLSYSTYLGASGGEMFMGIAVDGTGSAYVTGMTNSVDFPTTHGAYQGGPQGGPMDAMVAKLTPDGSALVYSTYLGGSAFDLAEAIAVDSAGNAYLSGMTSSRDFPVTENAFQRSHGGGEFDAFVTKLNADGTDLVYSTYLGGEDEEGTLSLMIPSTSKSFGLVVDADGSAYVKARTMSQDFPTTPDAFQSVLAGVSDSTVTKLNPEGSALVFSTYFGGSGFEFGKPIAVDADGNVFIGGRTNSTDLPVLHAVQPTFRGGTEDAYLAKFDPHGSTLIFSTYFGGSGPNEDRAFGLGVDAHGNAFVSGITASADFPTRNPLQAHHRGGGNDMWMAKFAGDGSLRFSTYWGGSGTDAAWDSVVDAAGNAHVTGRTNSTDFPVVNPLQATLAGDFDVVVVSLDSSGSAVRFSTYLGGSLADTAFRIRVDRAGNAYVTGWTASTDFPTVNPAQSASGGQHDGFIFEIRQRNVD